MPDRTVSVRVPTTSANLGPGFDSLGVALDWTALLTVTTLALSSGGDPPWEIAEWLRPFATLSLYVALALSLAMMMLGARIRRSS